MRPARSSTLRCLVIAGCVRVEASASSTTPAWPAARRSRIARRVGSARAAKARLRGSCIDIASRLYNHKVKCKSRWSEMAREAGLPSGRALCSSDEVGHPNSIDALCVTSERGGQSVQPMRLIMDNLAPQCQHSFVIANERGSLTVTWKEVSPEGPLTDAV